MWLERLLGSDHHSPVPRALKVLERTLVCDLSERGATEEL